MLRKIVIYILLMMLSIIGVVGQNNTSSPYSRYGYGTLVDATSAQGRGMGGLSVGLRHNQYINFGNPATHTAIDTLTFRFDLGASMRTSFMKDGDSHKSDLSGNLELIALQFPIRNWMGVSLGLMPYSVVGYNYEAKTTTTSGIDGGELKYTNTFDGTGGINQLMLGMGFNPWKPLSIGINLRLLFGTITSTSQVDFADANNANYYHTTIQQNNNKVKDFSINLGAQYVCNIGEEKNLVLGLVFDPKTSLNSEANKTINTSSVDTLKQNFDDAFDLPMNFGVGVSYAVTNKFMVGVDYKMQKWSETRYFGEKNFDDRHKVVVGAEFLPDFMSKAYFRRVSYRLGFSTANTYYKVKGDSYQENVLSGGFGFPLKRGLNPTVINFTIEYGFAGIGREDLMKDQSLRFVLNATINERWFVRRRLE